MLAVAVAVAVSPLAPLGQLHRLEPDPGVSFDWTVLGVGAALFLLVLSVRDGGAGLRRVLGRSRAAERLPAAGAAVTATLGLPVAARPRASASRSSQDRARYSRPARPSISGTVVALVILVGSLVFGASLSNLVSHPALYGWTWDREILAGSGYGNIPLPQASRCWAAIPTSPPGPAPTSTRSRSTATASRSSPRPTTRVSPPILAGHRRRRAAPDRARPGNAGPVGGHVGGTVRVFNGQTTLSMRVAGTATLPAIGVGHGIHPRSARGAVLPASALPRTC